MNSYILKLYINSTHRFERWIGTHVKNGNRIADVNDCADAWNAAITAAIRAANKPDDFSVIENIQKLKYTPDK